LIGLLLLLLGGGVAWWRSEGARGDLAGTWVIQLQLDHSEFRDRPTTRHVRGMLTLAPTTPGDARRGLGYPPTHSGRAQLDLRPFGFGERPWENVGSTTIMGDVRTQADVALAVDRADGVEIIVNPVVSHGGLALRGRWRSSGIRGEWIVRGFVPMATGSFEMHRGR
jgi:hypothetical protein